MINLKKFSLTLLVIFCVVFGVFAGDKTDIVGDGVKWFNTKPMNAKDFKGKVVFVEVFKTWQVSTDNTAAFLNLINETLKSPNFIVMGLSSEQPADVKKYIDEYKITYPVACGKNSLTSYKVDIPAMFLIVDGEIHSFDPTKKYKFNYLWTQLDNYEMMLNGGSDAWKAERRQKYYEMFKKTYKMSIDLRELKTIEDLPKDISTKYFEKSLLENLEPDEQANLLKVFYKQKEFNRYLLNEKASDADKKVAVDLLLKLKYKPIKINETFYKMTNDGMERIVDKKYNNPLGLPDVKMKKFANIVKKGQTNINDIVNIDIDNL